MSAPLYGATPADWDTFTLLLGLTTDLLPVVSNPSAEISPDSTMADLGKVPSHYNRAGKVVGFKGWPKHVASDQDIARWSRNPDYGICVITREVRAIDVDVGDPALAHRIKNSIVAAFGDFATRERSNSGKFLMAFRMPGDHAKRVIKVEGGIIEFLGTGQQFIAVGQHTSGVRYEWDGGLPDDFRSLTEQEFNGLWQHLTRLWAIEEVKPARQLPAEGSAPAAPTDPVVLAAALGAIPNTGADELDYDDWLHVIMALHYETGASDEGLAMAHAFSARSSKYNPDEVELEWGRIKGASSSGEAVTGRTVLHMARAHGWTEDVSGDFDVVVAPAPEPGKKVVAALPAFIRKDKSGEIVLNMTNMTRAIARPDMVGLAIGYDTFRDEIMYSEDDGENWSSFKDADYSRLRIALEGCGFPPPSKELTRDAVLLVAEQNRFDSAQVWLNRLEWDGVPRVASFLPRYFATDDTPYTRAVSRYIWTAMAGRVLEPGCQADMAPILVGPQGYLKSSGVAAMVPSRDFFAEISFGEKEDDLSRKMRGRLVAELAELKGLRGKDSEAIKAWMTKRYEDWTPKYREFNTVFPRRLLCVGTTNQDEFLVDVTGNRRWLPVRIGGLVDVDAITRDCSQMWAEARDWFNLVGVDYHEAEKLAVDQHLDYMVSDAWEPVVERWLNEPDMITDEVPVHRSYLQAHEVLEGALRLDSKSIKRADEMRLGAVLRTLGYTRKQMRVAGRRQWVYVGVDDAN